MSRVLVTGATGFIGRQALAPLRERGFEVHAVARRPGEDDDATWHEADLLEPGEAERVIDAARPTHLLHFAWYAEPRSFWQSPENRRWLDASVGLLRAFRGDRVAVAGTCAEYEWTEGVCRERETPLAPRGVYGACKDALRCELERMPVSSAWGRIFFVYGPHEPREKLVASTIVALLDGREARLSAGRQRRDFVHVADVGAAFAAILDSDVEGAVNVGSGEAIEVRELVERIGTLVGRPELLRFGATADEAPLVVADVSRLREEVGWRPKVALDDGLTGTIAWWRTRLSEQTPAGTLAASQGQERLGEQWY